MQRIVWQVLIVSLLIFGIPYLEAQVVDLPSEIKFMLAGKPMSDSSYQQLLKYLDTTEVSSTVRLQWIQGIIKDLDAGIQTEFRARSRQLLGSYLIDEGEYGEATNALLEGLRLAEENGHVLVESLCHNGLGIIDYYRSQLKGASYHWNIAVRKLDDAGLISEFPSVLSNLGANYYLMDMLDSAIHFHHRSLSLAEELNRPSDMANALNNLGNVYYEQRNFIKARELFNRALEIQTNLKNSIEMARTMNNIGATYEDEGQPDKALSIYHSALEIGLKETSYEVISFTYENLANANADLGRWRDAYESRVNYTHYHDSAFAEEQEMVISRLRTQYETEKKEKEIALLTQDQLITSVRISRQRILLVGSALLLALMGILVWSVAKARSKFRQLLLNILPAPVINELNRTGSTKAKLHQDVSVLFTDFVDFTPISKTLSPERLVYYLNQYFSFFDEICAKYGLEKIKTIGDSYMCASGLTSNQEDHTLNLVAAARQMIRYAMKQEPIAGVPNFQLRAGIHTGPVIAGVVGKKKFAYDIWGDTVNTAARMEQIGATNEITFSTETYLQIKNHIDCIAKGLVDVKGKGPMQIYGIEVLSRINSETS